MALSDKWWFVAHSADLLSKLDYENEELLQLRDSFILNYAESMLGNKVTFDVAKIRSGLAIAQFQQIRNLIKF